MKLRRLNDAGMAAFKTYIENLNSENKSIIQKINPLSEEFTESLSYAAEIDPSIVFESRYQFGEYLNSIFTKDILENHFSDAGFWSWISLCYFDQLAAGKDGQLNPSKYYNYILSLDYRHRPRHAVFTTWQLVNKYGSQAKFMLFKSMAMRGEIAEQFLARQFYVSCEGVFRVMSSLYTSKNGDGVKYGAASRDTPGTIYRFIKFLQQIEFTYDLYAISPEHFQEILPAEFDRFKR